MTVSGDLHTDGTPPHSCGAPVAATFAHEHTTPWLTEYTGVVRGICAPMVVHGPGAPTVDFTPLRSVGPFYAVRSWACWRCGVWAEALTRWFPSDLAPLTSPTATIVPAPQVRGGASFCDACCHEFGVTLAVADAHGMADDAYNAAVDPDVILGLIAQHFARTSTPMRLR